MLQRLYKLKEPTKNGIELADRMLADVRDLAGKIRSSREVIVSIHPELAFLIKDNPEQLKLAKISLNIAVDTLDKQHFALKTAIHEQESVFFEMETVLNLLKDRKVDEFFLKKTSKDDKKDETEQKNGDIFNKTPATDGSSVSSSKSLYDYIDDKAPGGLIHSLSILSSELKNQIEFIESTRKKVVAALERVEGSESFFISISAEDIDRMEKRIEINNGFVSQIEEDHESLHCHDKQLNEVIRQLERENQQLSEQDYLVLSHDTQEIGLIVGEMQDTMSSLRTVADECHVRAQQYSTFIQEYKNQAIMLSDVFELISLSFRQISLSYSITQSQLSSFHALTKEMWNLTAWYQEYYLAYCDLVLEFHRRNQVRKTQKKWLENVTLELDKMYNDELSIRRDFVENLGKYLPGDLCPQVHNLPDQYVVHIVLNDDDTAPTEEAVQFATNSLAGH